MRPLLAAVALAVLLLTGANAAGEGSRTHVVARGQTIGGIAHRYGVTVKALCAANGIVNANRVRAGQKLVIPSDSPAARTRAKASKPRSSLVSADRERALRVPGHGNAYYYEPTGPGRLTLRPVIMYLHGHGGQPAADCRRWAKVARRVGWLVCPSGPEVNARGRGWHNRWQSAHAVATATVKALRDKYGRRVQLYGNTLIGFSEGAFVAMNVGVREPKVFNRWLLLGASDRYWAGSGRQALARAKSRLRRVYLITGEHDGVIDNTRKVRSLLRKYGVPTRITTPGDMGHEVDLGRRPELYRMALVWLQSGGSRL